MEKGKRTTYLQLKSVCFYEKQTPLQYLHVLSDIFFPFIFLSCIKKGQFVMKRLSLQYQQQRQKKKKNSNISYTFSCLWGNETTQRLEMNVKLWTASRAKQRRHEGHKTPNRLQPITALPAILPNDSVGEGGGGGQ